MNKYAKAVKGFMTLMQANQLIWLVVILVV